MALPATIFQKAYIASYLAARCIAEFYGEQSFDGILSALGRGKNIDEAMTEATGKSMSEFQSDTKTGCAISELGEMLYKIGCFA